MHCQAKLKIVKIEDKKKALDTQRVQMMDSLVCLLGLSTIFQVFTEQKHFMWKALCM